MRPQLLVPGDLPACDWRVQIWDCADAEFYRNLYVVTAVVAGLVWTLIAALLLFRRVHWGIRLVHNDLVRGPEGLLFCLMIWTMLLFVHSIVLLADIAPPRILLELTFNLSFLFTVLGVAAYLNSFILATPVGMLKLARIKRNIRLPRRNVIYRVVSFFALEVPLTFLPLAVLTGLYADTPFEAVIYQIMLNWQAVHFLLLEIFFFIIGNNFVRILKFNLLAMEKMGTSPRKLKLLRITVSKVEQIVLAINFAAVDAAIQFMLGNCYYVYQVQPWARTLAVLYLTVETVAVLYLVIKAAYVDFQKVKLGQDGDEKKHPMDQFMREVHANKSSSQSSTDKQGGADGNLDAFSQLTTYLTETRGLPTLDGVQHADKIPDDIDDAEQTIVIGTFTQAIRAGRTIRVSLFDGVRKTVMPRASSAKSDDLPSNEPRSSSDHNVHIELSAVDSDKAMDLFLRTSARSSLA
eukprot:Unigene2438_Nuclearia_a/m.7528 Unigene2438_Nuclearia_a/g.7528  ORF Unigene2438_Nuclearia_a/g.7528 Unigene2438_Nuclearia_a/m.7528 type:complete len:464 (-) Unigene2438_Nuclearia_a:76-1467(-)